MHISLFLLSMLMLFGCTTSPVITTSTPPVNWAKTVAESTQIQDWHLTGQLGIQTERTAQSFTIDWQQKQQNYRILCFGPLGQFIAELSGTPAFATLKIHTGEQKTGNPIFLLRQVLNVSLPLQSLLFWVRGIPDPNIPSTVLFYKTGEIAEFYQLEWKITYFQQKIIFEKLPVRIKLVISGWTFSNQTTQNVILNEPTPIRFFADDK